MLPALASPADLETWLGQQIEAPAAARAQAILHAASTLVRNHTGRPWIVDGDDGPTPEDGVSEVRLDAVRTVVITVAARVYTNPNGTVAQTTGPFSRTVAAWASLGLALSDDERSLLSGGGFRGLGTVPTTRGDLETAAVIDCYQRLAGPAGYDEYGEPL